MLFTSLPDNASTTLKKQHKNIILDGQLEIAGITSKVNAIAQRLLQIGTYQRQAAL